MKGADKVVWIIVALVLVVIFLAIFVPLLLQGGKWGFSTIQKMIGDWLNFQSPEEKTLLKAMSCAYYRCIEGCSSGKIKQAKWEDENGEKVSCLESFCKDEWRDSKGKICGNVAKENPVKIYLDSPVTISEYHWKIFFEDWDVHKPFLAQGQCEAYGLYLFVGSMLGVPPPVPWPFATKAIVLPESVECTQLTNFDKRTNFITKFPAGFDVRGAIAPPSGWVESCELPEMYYNIWSGSSGGIDEEDIIICSGNE